MGDRSAIEWTDATWNPITGCSVVSPGCTNCYAMKLAGTRLRHHPSREGLTSPSKAGPVWNGKVRLNEAWLAQPLGWKRPRRIFVCAHGDLFHEAVPYAWIDKVFAVMALAPRHTFQVLTKRSRRMRDYLSDPAVLDRLAAAILALRTDDRPVGPLPHLDPGARWFPIPNVWLGVSAEDQARADERIPNLLNTPAAIRFLSAEPLLGPLRLNDLTADGDSEMDALAPRAWREEIEGWRGSSDTWEADFLDWFELHQMPDPAKPMHPTLDWVIAGGESGPDARPMHPDWARSLRDQALAAGVPFFFKQWGEHSPYHAGPATYVDVPDPGRPSNTYRVARIGKKAAGRLLDGVQHDGMPGSAA